MALRFLKPPSHRRGIAGALAITALLTACQSPQPTTPPRQDLSATVDGVLKALPANGGAVAPAVLDEVLSHAPPAIVDVREPEEIARKGGAPGAIQIPLRTLPQHLDQLPPRSTPIVTVCASGHRSAMAMLALRLLGWTDVSSLAGGLEHHPLPPFSPRPVSGPGASDGAVAPDVQAAVDRALAGMSTGWNTLSPAMLAEMLASSRPYQIDVRSADQRGASASVRGAVEIPLEALIHNLAALPPDRNAVIVVESEDGHRGAVAMFSLTLLGFTNVRSLAGGLVAWRASGHGGNAQ